jgi:hypothetical protein
MMSSTATFRTSTTIVPGDEEAVEAEMIHHRDLIPRHRPLRVRRVIGGRRRLAAVAVAGEVGGDDGELLGEAWGDGVPHHVRLRVAVEQQEWRAAAAVPHANRRRFGFDHRQIEPFEHRAPPLLRRMTG